MWDLRSRTVSSDTATSATPRVWIPPAFAFSPNPGLADWVEVLEERVRAGRVAVRAAKEAGGDRCLVLAGMSLGALAALAVANLEGDVDGLVLMLGGGDLERLAERLPRLDPRFSTISLAEAGPELTGRLTRVDALAQRSRLPPGSILLMDAMFDAVVPAESATKLWETLGRPERRRYPTGHYSFGFAFPAVVDAVAGHAERVCNPEHS